MTQVIVIHGGTTFAKYDDYLNYLKTKTINLDRFKYMSKWKETLQEKLGSEFEVLLPSMPNSTNASYNEWKVWFDNLSKLLEDGCILVGHSMGAIFLAKYLSENAFTCRIKATILIAAPFNDERTEDLTDFKLKEVSELFKSQSGKNIFFFGFDDPVIDSSEIQKYKDNLPSSEYNILPAPDHFLRSDFPELVATIASI